MVRNFSVRRLLLHLPDDTRKYSSFCSLISTKWILRDDHAKCAISKSGPVQDCCREDERKEASPAALMHFSTTVRSARTCNHISIWSYANARPETSLIVFCSTQIELSLPDDRLTRLNYPTADLHCINKSITRSTLHSVESIKARNKLESPCCCINNRTVSSLKRQIKMTLLLLYRRCYLWSIIRFTQNDANEMCINIVMDLWDLRLMGEFCKCDWIKDSLSLLVVDVIRDSLILSSKILKSLDFELWKQHFCN